MTQAPGDIQTSAPPATVRRLGWLGILVEPRAYQTLYYMLFAGVSGPLTFAWVTLGLVLCLPLALAGIPLFLPFAGSVRLLSRLESRILEILLGMQMPRRPAAASASGYRDRIRAALRDPRNWSAIAYMLLRLPLGFLYTGLVLLCLLLPGAFLWAGAWSVSGQIRLYPPDPSDQPLWRDFLSGRILHETAGTMHIHGAPDWLTQGLQMPLLAGMIAIAAGFLLFLPLLHLARAVGQKHGTFAREMLG